MAWNTGSSSPGELEMMRSTSAVAACCSSAPASFFSRSAWGSRMRLTRVPAFVLVERRSVMRVRLFAPLRDKVTSSAKSLVPFGSAQLPFHVDHLVGRYSRNGTLWNIDSGSASLRLDAGEFDHLGPVLGFFG